MKNNYLFLIVICLVFLLIIVGLKNNKSFKENWNNWNNKIVEEKIEESKEKIEVKPEEKKEQIFAASYKQALEISKEKNIKVFLYFFNNYCCYCKKIENETLENKEVKKELINYVIYKCNTDVEKALSKRYNVSHVPAYFVIDYSENIIKKEVGFKPKDEFINWLD